MSAARLLPAALLAALAYGQTAQLRSIEPVRSTGNVFLRSYQAASAPAVRLNNSPRFGQLLRAGTLYLTVQDAIALALENNIDLEIARYSPIMAAWRLERALSGGLLPGVPSSAGQVGNVASGQGVTGSQAAAGVGGGGGGGRGAGTNASISQIGPVTQNLDPVFQHASTFSHTTTPQSNVTQSLIYALTADTRVNTSSLQQGFLSGGSVTLTFKENYLKENSPSNVFNPSTAANLSLGFQHSLLRGFGVAVNSRTITVSRMNLKNTDLMFKRSVIAVTAQVLNLYYNLSAALEDVGAKRLALEAAETLERNVGRQVELGVTAETERTRVAAQTASAKQALIVAESTLEQQQLRLKNLLSRNGLAEPGLAAAKIHPLDKFQAPAAGELPAVEEMVRQAKQNRVELALDQENLKASRISAAGTANGVLPTLITFGGASNAGLAGTPTGSRAAGPGTTGDYFVGGFANATGQVFRRNFPSQRIGVFFQAPLGNNQANADQLIDQLQLRQSELGAEKRLSQVEVDVRTGVTALRQARARYEAAGKNRTLQEQLAQAEERKFALGASTPQAVLLAQRDLAAARSAEVAALAAFSNARVALDQTLGRTLEANNVVLSEVR